MRLWHGRCSPPIAGLGFWATVLGAGATHPLYATAQERLAAPLRARRVRVSVLLSAWIVSMAVFLWWLLSAGGLLTLAAQGIEAGAHFVRLMTKL